MKIKTKLFSSFIVIFLWLNGISQYGNTMNEALALYKTTEKFHVDFHDIDKESSEYIFQNTINNIDKQGLIFTQEDIESLEKYKYALKLEILDKKTDFLYALGEIYHMRSKGLPDLFKIQKAVVYDFTIQDTFFYKEKNIFVPNDKLEKKCELWIKFLALYRYIDEKDSTQIDSPFDQDKINAIKDTIVDEQIKLLTERLEKRGSMESKISKGFLSAIAKSFDPHTEYFSSDDRQEFYESLSATKFTFGLEIEENDDAEIEISAIIPGSSAWNSEEFEIGDIILAVQFGGKKWVDFSQISLEKALSYLHNESITEAKFKLRKIDGKNVIIDIVKTQINNEDNLINSYILEDNRKIAYISLPGFYIDAETNNGCANDIAKELIQLNKEGIDGLIFDLRGNGGGSMEEAIKLCGMFINHGALFIYKSKEETPETIKDINKGLVYDRPMIVMVDKSSCSAAELFTAVMQDYHRAIIVGSNTYGKSTSQIVLPVKSDEYEISRGKKGFVKMTVGKLYRCTGQSYQKQGVQVDIHLPDIFDYLELGEKYESRSLEADTINKKTYYYPLTELPISSLSANSSERIKNTSSYHDIMNNLKYQADIIQNKAIPLNFESFKKIKLMDKDTIRPKNKDSKLRVRIPDYIEKLGSLSEVYKNARDKRCKQLKQDSNIQEAYFILNDLILQSE